MTQQNAPLVEQSSLPSISLREEALKLSDSVSVFRIQAYSQTFLNHCLTDTSESNLLWVAA